VFKDGGYRYVKAGFQFSSGVAAEPGFEIERARLSRPLPLSAGLAAVEAHLAALGRPTSAFAACELRSPQPFSERGFDDFNREYVKTLSRWGIGVELTAAARVGYHRWTFPASSKSNVIFDVRHVLVSSNAPESQRFLGGLIGYVRAYHPEIAEHLTKQREPGHIIVPGQQFMPPPASEPHTHGPGCQHHH